MARNKVNSRALRELAEDLIDGLSDLGGVPEHAADGLVTSLVRQWITYDGKATLFLDETHQVRITVSDADADEPCCDPAPALRGWVSRLVADWKIDPEDLPEILEQLNLGQGAEVVNTEGVPLRLWVDPGKGSQGVEPLVKQDGAPGRKRDHRKIAADILESQFGDVLGPDEIGDLACAVAHQWERHEGRACLYLEGCWRLSLKFVERGDGSCNVTTNRSGVDVLLMLVSRGLAPDDVPDAVERLNRGREVAYLDREGVPWRLWNDPEAGRVRAQPLGPVPTAASPAPRPLLCPRCTAVLGPWRDGEREQTCPLCGHNITPG